ncbi:hypothetical protein M422DRAFT_36109 [Sphaerobolus stellatus SS14]|uniref:NACHT domain-containing protein n=1 Tax=Sphaerobolus stellatus (strain SS14) TaxID=990650 RepID=A0A0C9URB4_SPHS4|nr:hypothetical protein M422DRAFT_36109 [Sphaerobolus stellatus SS14]
MASNLGRIEVTKIHIKFEESFPYHHRLRVRLDRDKKDSIYDRSEVNTAYWILKPPLNIWRRPGIQTKLVVQPCRRRTVDLFSIAKEEDIVEITADELAAHDGTEYSRDDPYKAFKVTVVKYFVPWQTSDQGQAIHNQENTILVVDVPVPSTTISGAGKWLNDLAIPLDILRTSSKILTDFLSIAKALQGIHLFVDIAIKALTLAAKVFEGMRQYNDGLRDITVQLYSTLLCLEEIETLPRSKALEDAVIGVMKVATDVGNFIHNYLTKHRAKKLKDALFNNSDVQNLQHRLSICRQAFNEAVNVESHVTIKDLVSQMGQVLSNTEEQLLRSRLLPVNPSGWLETRCMENTRLDILDEIRTWIGDRLAPNLFLLTADPGAGKSTIASTIVSELAQSRCVPYFFFKRGDPARSDPTNVWKTVAFSLAQHPLLKEELFKQTANPIATGGSIRDVFDYLIKQPLTKMGDKLSEYPPIVVLDAVDECDSEHRGYPSLIEVITSWNRLPSSYKLLVTSRHHEKLEESLSCYAHIGSIATGNQVTSSSNHDIRTFIEAKVKQIFQRKRKSPLPSHWGSERNIEKLVERAAGLFIWASTVLEFISTDPEVRLRDILESPVRGSGTINQLYEDILQASSSTFSPDTVKKILETITIAKTDIRYDALAGLLDDKAEATTIENVLSSLSSVILSFEDIVTMRHQSFRDFLLNGSTLPLVNHGEASCSLVRRCLLLMSEGLRFNICDISSSFELTDNRSPESIDLKIPPCLQYACRFWIEHLIDLPNEEDHIAEIESCIANFLHSQLLWWIEVLSCLHATDYASSALFALSRWLKRTELSVLAFEGARFVTTFREPISSSIPHMYLSALSFTPTSSPISTYYTPKYSHRMHVNMEPEMQWPALLSILIGHSDHVNSVAVSWDETRIVSGSIDQTVRVWDASTGMQIGEALRGHEDWVRSVAFSADGTRIVSGSDDRTVRVWNALTGMQIEEALRGHEHRVRSVAFSADGTRIVSGSDDRTVRVWDASTGMQIGEALQGHEGGVTSVAFSADGTHIVSGSHDKTVRVWDASTEMQIGEALRGNRHEVRSVAFSADGTRIVSGSDDRTVRVWDTSTGMQIGEALRGHERGVTSVAFSADGTWIVSGSHDETVQVWDASTRMQIGEALQGHEHGVRSVAFSADGTRIVSGSDDRTVRVWNALTGMQIEEALRGHEHRVRSVAFSADGTRIVSGSDNRTVRVWDALTGMQIGEALQGHEGGVTSVAFSTDGTRIVSGSHDKTVRVWDASTQMQIGEALRGNRHEVRSVTFSADGTHNVWVSNNKEVRPLIVASTPAHHLGQPPNEVHSIFSDGSIITTEGWVLSQDTKCLFWVPLHYRLGLCRPSGLLVIGAPNCKVDFEASAHGMSWTDCYTP